MQYRLPIVLFAVIILTSCNNGKEEFDASGNFETDEVIVSAEANGKIMKLKLEEGMHLNAGEEIGYIDSVPLFLQFHQAQASIQSILGKRPDIEIQLSAIEQQIATQEREKKRIENLVRADAATQKQLDDINAAIDLLKKQYEAQKSSLGITSGGLQKDTLPISFQQKVLKDQLRKCHIINPISGTVLTKYAMQNEITGVGKALYKIANLDTLILRAYITGTQLPQVKLNQQLHVFVDNGPDKYKEYKGMISWVSDKSEFTPKTIQTKDDRANLVYAVKIKVPNDGYLKIGMFGEVKF